MGADAPELPRGQRFLPEQDPLGAILVFPGLEHGLHGDIGEGAVVRQNQDVPPDAIAVGTPARLLDKTVSPEFKEQWTQFKQIYVDLATRYQQGFVPLSASE